MEVIILSLSKGLNGTCISKDDSGNYGSMENEDGELIDKVLQDGPC